MISLPFVLLLLAQTPPPPPGGAPPATQPAGPPTTSAVVYDSGPLRAEVTAMREVRFWVADPEMAQRMESDLQLRFRMAGERIRHVARLGNLILSEVVDSTGKALVDQSTYSEEERKTTRPLTIPLDQLRSNGLLLSGRTKASGRGATSLQRVRGTIRLIFAEETQRITIDNPMQFYGRVIEDPRLKELGIEIEIVPPDQVENAPPANRALVFRYRTKAENVQKAMFYDGNLRQLSARDTWTNSQAGDQCHLYYFDGSPFNDELQMVLEVHPHVEDVQFPVNLDNLPLP